MAQEFVPSPSESSEIPKPPQSSGLSKPKREPVRVMVIGSRHGVNVIIQTLHSKDFANADDWSELQIEPVTGQMMSVVTKYVWSE
ncbi:MAG: hypothetical protein HC769_06090 [Cyanobacteria bacterium CRU_2_1]|nr:hypothetical protein [Cyanobacteria bacterium RU_5_0]NJR58456.1 hypothetical protein [Cyanobacteria bacterium CRU_2_1]